MQNDEQHDDRQEHGHDDGRHGDHEQPVAHERIVAVEEVVRGDEVVIVEEIIDVEFYAKQKRKPPHARGYRIRIDKEYREVQVSEMTGRQVLALVGKTPEAYLLSQKLQDGRVVPVAAEQTVDFRHHGIERFQTIALDPTEGGGHAA